LTRPEAGRYEGRGPARKQFGEKMSAPAIAGVQRSAIRAMIEREHARFASANPRSRELAAVSTRHWLHGVPMHWMLDWGTPFPLFVAAAKGATFTDADGHGYADFCLGDTGAMFGHASTAAGPSEQSARGHFMLPRGAIWVGEDPAASACAWQFTLTATDANRFAIRLARP
jgi:glutamate-1-semialdehyde 2,1-aminomutase